MKTKKPKFKNPIKDSCNNTIGLFWHVHHDIPCEWCYSLEERKDAIEKTKPDWEQPRRLALLKPVKNVPKDIQDLINNDVDYHNNDVDYYIVDDWVVKHPALIQRLHAKECGCNFYRNLGDLFSRDEYWAEKAPARPRKRK